MIDAPLTDNRELVTNVSRIGFGVFWNYYLTDDYLYGKIKDVVGKRINILVFYYES